MKLRNDFRTLRTVTHIDSKRITVKRPSGPVGRCIMIYLDIEALTTPASCRCKCEGEGVVISALVILVRATINLEDFDQLRRMARGKKRIYYGYKADEFLYKANHHEA